MALRKRTIGSATGLGGVISVQHRKLQSKADAERMKVYRSERLGALAQMLVPKT
jgi:hypothetical protein